jgi:four helix bundle protein
MHNFKELLVWQKSRILVKDVYELMVSLPNTEKYGIVSQIQRAVISIPANIAEGSGRGSNKDFSRFLDISIASAFELETEIILCCDISFISEHNLNLILPKIQEIQKMLYSFKGQLKIDD